MALRELKESHKYLVDEQGQTKKDADLEEAIERKIAFQINEAGYYIYQFIQMADKETQDRIR